MHDQKLTEEYLTMSTGERLWPIGGTGSEPKTDNGRWMYGPHMGESRMVDPMPAFWDWNDPHAIRMRKHYEMPNADQFYKDFWKSGYKRLFPKPIDHPYLLPPASPSKRPVWYRHRFLFGGTIHDPVMWTFECPCGTKTDCKQWSPKWVFCTGCKAKLELFRS